MKPAGIIFRAIYIVVLLCTPTRLWAESWDEAYDPPRLFDVSQGINYRSGPNNNNEVLGVLKQGERLTVFGVVKGWYKFQKADGTSGYVFKKFLQPASGDAPAPDAPGQPPVSSSVLPPSGAPAPAGPAVPGHPTPSVPAVPVQPSDALTSDCTRLVIKPGGTTASGAGTVAAGVQDCFELPLAQSQWVEVWLVSTQGKAGFDIFSPVGAAIISNETHWLGRAETMGNYIILVGGKAEKTEYTVKVQVR